MVKQIESEIVNNQGQLAGDEIDLLALVKSVFSTWRFVLVALLLVSLLFGTYKAIKIAFLPGEVTYSKPIRLTFKGADKLEFPSGAKFAYGDIIAPAVAALAHQRNNLSAYGISVEQLQQSLRAEPYAPTYDLIMLKYQKKMADKKLTIEQLAELESNMWSDIKQATSGTVLISMQFEKLTLPEDVASKLLSDIAAIWAEKTIHDKGVLNINIPISTAKTLDPQLIGRVEYIIVSDLLKEKLELLRVNIKLLTEFQGAATIKDPVTGMGLVDLSTAVEDFSKYIVDDALSPIRQLGLAKNNRLSVFYYEDKLKKLEMELVLFENQAVLAKDAYDSYVQAGPQGSGLKSGATQQVSPQVDSDFLDKLVAMSGDSEREKYRQKLNQQWLTLTLKASQVKNQIAEVNQILASLKKAESANSGVKNGLELEYQNRVKADLPLILTKLTSFFDVTDRIYTQMSVESVGLNDQLYHQIINGIMIDKVGLEIKQTVLTWFALMFLTMVIVAPSIMIRRALREKTEI